MLFSSRSSVGNGCGKRRARRLPRLIYRATPATSLAVVECLEGRELLSGLGVLDPTFGQGGGVISDTLGKSNDQAFSTAITQPDGKILVAGSESQPVIGAAFFVARYNADGSLDTRFGENGFVRTGFAPGGIGGGSMALTPDGKIVVAGQVFVGGKTQVGVARYSSDGLLDTAFGTSGQVIVSGAGQTQFGFGGIAIDSSGDIDIAGDSYVFGTSEIGLVRLTETGALDSAFGSGGFATLAPSNAQTSVGQGIVVEGDGKLVVAGSVNFKGSVVRFDAHGILDTAFGQQGIAANSLAANEGFHAVTIDGNGRIVAAGGYSTGVFSQESAVARFNADGSVDVNFGASGLVTTAFGGSLSDAEAVAIDPQGRIVTAGFAQIPVGTGQIQEPFAVARYNNDGSLDSTFGLSGRVMVDFNGQGAQANALALNASGGAILAGESFQGGTNSIALAQLFPDGTLDPSFGTGGKVVSNLLTSTSGDSRAMAIQPDGKIIAVGASTPATGEEFALMRYNADGTLDASFGQGGVTTTQFTMINPYSRQTEVGNAIAEGVAIDDQGRIVVAGYESDNNGKSTIVLARYSPDGSLDPTFGVGGQVTTDINFSGTNKAFNVKIDSSGKIVVAGFTGVYPYSSYEDFAVLRYNSDGTLDGSFGSGGEATIDFFGQSDEAYGLAIQSDGKIVVGGTAYQPNAPADMAVARLNADGTLDASFGSGGKATADFGSTWDFGYGMTLDAQGRIIMAGASYRGYPTYYDFAVARFSSNGTLDPSFGAGGEVLTDFNGANDFGGPVTVNNDGKIIVAGEAYNAAANYDFAFAVYNDDGSLDADIGNGGKVTTDLTGQGNRDQIYGIALDSQQRLVVAGSTFRPDTSYDFGLARYILDPAPTASVSGSTLGVPGQPLTFSVGATDEPADEASGFSYTIDWGDGSPQTTISAAPNNGGGVALQHVYLTTGSYTITATASNDDGIVSAPATLAVSIQTAAIETDPSDSGKTALFVGGTSADDRIVIRPALGQTGKLVIDENGVLLGPFAPSGHIVVYGQAGNDDIEVDQSIRAPVWLFGGDGNDLLRGGGGNDVIMGGAGHNLLLAGLGRNLLVAGGDSSVVLGGPGDDILIAGDLHFADLDAALTAIMDEWTSADDFATRVADLNVGGGLNGNYILSLAGGTVTLSQANDLLFGGGGGNWFFYDSSRDLIAGEISAANDQDPLLKPSGVLNQASHALAEIASGAFSAIAANAEDHLE